MHWEVEFDQDIVRSFASDRKARTVKFWEQSDDFGNTNSPLEVMDLELAITILSEQQRSPNQIWKTFPINLQSLSLADTDSVGIGRVRARSTSVGTVDYSDPLRAQAVDPNPLANQSVGCNG